MSGCDGMYSRRRSDQPECRTDQHRPDSPAQPSATWIDTFLIRRECARSHRSVLVGAQSSGEIGDVTSGSYPDLVRVDSVVMVCKHDPESCDVAPGHVCMTVRGRVFEEVGGFADDLE